MMTYRTASRSKPTRQVGGYTLIEIILVLAITSAVLGTTVGLITTAGRSHESSNNSLFQRQEIRRFADDLRRDMHRSVSHTIESDSIVMIVAETGDSSDDLDREPNELEITYRVESQSRVSRTVQTENKSPEASDFYAFESVIKIDLKQGEQDGLVEFDLVTEQDQTTPFQILASHRVSQ